MPGESARINGRKGGRPKGSVSSQTLDKAAAREMVRQRVIERLGPLLDAQMAHAEGIKYLVVRNVKTGKFERVTKERMDGLLESGKDDELERLEVWDKDPSVQAFTDLLNRALDKPAEQKQEIDLTVRGDADLVARLQSARKREK